MRISAEGFGPWRMGDDEALLDVVSSANIACGFHAGDPLIMERPSSRRWRGESTSAPMWASQTARASAGERCRSSRPNSPPWWSTSSARWPGSLAPHGVRMTHMSFHGALGNMAAADEALADTACGGRSAFRPGAHRGLVHQPSHRRRRGDLRPARGDDLPGRPRL